ncbi:MAG TPA: response regulator transcription factor [Chloroflexaceae bacterium]|nr:response regulator transcription factor [Chloroflexaceae bacterium]
MTTVFIIAPTPALRAGLRAMLAGEGVEVVGEAAGAALAPAADVVLVAGDDPAAAGRALAGDEGAALVALSDDPRLPALLRAMPLRGWAVAPPDAGPEELGAAVAAAAQGFVAVPRQLAEQLAPRPAGEPPAEPLTAREGEVLALLSQGLPNKQIALRLQISEHTVKFHIAAIFAKLGAASRTEAVSIGARQGLITL